MCGLNTDLPREISLTYSHWDPKPETLNPETLNPETLNPETSNPKPWNLKPQNPINPKP